MLYSRKFIVTSLTSHFNDFHGVVNDFTAAVRQVKRFGYQNSVTNFPEFRYNGCFNHI